MRKVDLAAIIAVNIEKENQRLKAEQESHRLSANRAAKRLESIAEKQQLTAKAEREEKNKEDQKKVKKLIDKVAPLMPKLCKDMSPNNGLRVIFSFSKTDLGPWSCRVLKDGVGLKDELQWKETNNSLKEGMEYKEWRIAKLREKLEADGWSCSTEEDMMAEILDLRNTLKEYKSALAELRKYQE